MKFAISIAACLILGLAPSAFAQVTCAEVNRVTTSGLDDFGDIEGEEIEDGLYKTSYWIAGAQECGLEFDFDSIYSCLWTFDSYASASAALNMQAASVAACLPGWTSSPLTPDAQATDGYRAVQGTFYAGPAAYEDMEWAVYMEEHTFDGKQDWHVWVGLAYLL